MLSITVDIKPLQAALAGAAKQSRFAGAQAINDTLFQVRTAEQREVDVKFDRVTPYIRRSFWVTQATPDTLAGELEPKYYGGKGVDPQNVLRAEVYGGSRKLKGSERALQRAGILPTGYSIVPGQACPLDQYGNIRGSFLLQIITYFGASGEQGYRANMTDKRKAALAKKGKSANGYATINGVVYFVAYGKLRSGPTHHLAPGIWARSGIHGSTIKPILMFVRTPAYRQRFDFYGVAQRTVDQNFAKAFSARYAAAIRTASP